MAEYNIDNSNEYFWKSILEEKSYSLFPTDHKRPDNLEKSYNSIAFNINRDAQNYLSEIANEQDKLQITLFSAYQLLTHRYTEQKESCIMFANADTQIPVYLACDGEQTVNSLLHSTSLSIEQSKTYAAASYAEYTQALHSIFIFNSRESYKSDDFLNETINYNFDIGLVLQQDTNGFSAILFFNEYLFLESTILKMAAHYQNLLTGILTEPRQKIGAIPMLTPDEFKELSIFNDTTKPYPVTKTLNTLFEEQAVKTPANTALYFGEHSISYNDLNEKANQLARYLINRGVGIGDNVGLLVNRGFDMIVGMYAILKAGAAYVPVDPEYPTERQHYILSNSAVSLVLTDSEYPVYSSLENGPFINLTKCDLSAYEKTNLDLAINSNNLAYTIYTSGSTGRPKGVMITHTSAVNLVLWVNDTFNINADDRLLFITSMCFDLSVYDIFGILATGGSLVIANQSQINDFNQLQDILQKYKITFWDSVPTTLDYLIKELESAANEYKQNYLRLVFLSGDWIPVSLPNRVKKYFPKANVISLGGATEGTVWSNFFPVETTSSYQKSIPYGKPITNNFFYILNDQLQPLPLGVAGELFIGGIGVAQGYANDAEKTAYSFIKDPFNAHLGGMMYRTGDLGRMLPSMDMEFIGRKDNQVKIRGFRVELGEIESVLNQYKNIATAVVITKNDKQNTKQLVCYFVSKGHFEKDLAIQHLKSSLPEYMIPLMWVELKSLPLNSNGKIDRKALPDVEITPQVNTTFIEPVTSDEITMSKIWQEVIKLEKIGLNDNFFELGGHSLLALQIMARFEKQTGKKIPSTDIFKNPTISSLLASHNVEEDVSLKWKSLIPLRTTGNKVPLYIIHGDGLFSLGFKDLVDHMDLDQPVYGLQPSALNGSNDEVGSMTDIAKKYIDEIMSQNPNGPYALAGYSFGGYLAIEMEKLLTQMGKEVKMLAIFDTNAENALYNQKWRLKLPKKIIRQFPKLLWIAKSAVKDPKTTFNYQRNLFRKKINAIRSKPISAEAEIDVVAAKLKLVDEKYTKAFKEYIIPKFNNTVYLFKAKTRLYYVDDAKYLGWKKYAKKGVKIFDVPGDHATMLKQPHVKKLAHVLQQALDEVMS